ncbi:hypothetical protein CSA37_11165 [Candidatus Fermentibacteria bacterium]|nr:MAG: hypothetical protein CSA37_11165 [Candidatus Fermentibacteria bacterium]
MTEKVCSVEKAGRGRAFVTLPSGRFLVAASEAPGIGTPAEPQYLEELQRAAAREDAGNYLAAAERSTGQLHKRLVAKGYSSDTASQTVKWAEEYGYVDDMRFSSLLAGSRVLGRAGMKRELLRKGVSPQVVEQVLADFSDSDRIDELVRTVVSRYGSLEDRERARRRAAGWLSRRGFSSEVIFRVLQEAL